MKKLFLLPLAACLLVACPGTGGGEGGSGKVDPVVFNYDKIGTELEAALTADGQSTYINAAKDFTLDHDVKVAAIGGKFFGRVTGSYGGSEGYVEAKSFQIKKAGGDVLTFTGLKGFTKITVVSLTTYTDSTAEKLVGIKANGAAVTSADAITTVATGFENKDTADATKTYPVYSITLTYAIDASTTSFAVTAPAGNAGYFQSITLA